MESGCSAAGFVVVVLTVLMEINKSAYETNQLSVVGCVKVSLISVSYTHLTLPTIPLV